jgi:hypothetical protein
VTSVIERLEAVLYAKADEIVSKWKYLKANRPDFLKRYSPLFAYLGSKGAV